MANKDQNSNVGFSNTNIYFLYKKAKAAADTAQKPSSVQESVARSSKVIRDEQTSYAKIEKFTPASLNHSEEIQSMDNLKANLNRLQEMHNRLNFMLRELETLVARKK